MRQGVPLAPKTTLGVGGSAAYFLEIHSQHDLEAAALYARTHKLPVALLGGGSNTLVPDQGIDGLVLWQRMSGVEYREDDEHFLITVGAGVSWDTLVEDICARGLWGVENLAGIPGTVGGALVQNIGAYGAELAQVVECARVFNLTTGETSVLPATEFSLAYRSSCFKTDRSLVITNVTLRLGRSDAPLLQYHDLKEAQERGEALTSPLAVASCVRAIRREKFPDLALEGTAGSFFKNPTLSVEEATALKGQFPGLPTYAAGGGVKIPIAWILDHVLGMKGYRKGAVRLFERQPLVVVVDRGARAEDVEALAQEVVERVYNATKIKIEREVETLLGKKLSTSPK